MKHYEVEIVYTWRTTIEVEAETEEQAMEFAIEEAECRQLDGEYEVEWCEEIGGEEDKF